MRGLRSEEKIWKCAKLLGVAAVCALALLAGRTADAQATASYSVSANLPSTATPFGPSGLLSVAKYDPTLHNYGNLQSAKITWNISTSITWSYTNHGTATNITAASNKASGVLYFPGTSTAVLSSLASTTPFTLPQAIGAGQTLSGSSTGTGGSVFFTVPGNDAFGHSWTSANLVSFTGSGNVTFNVQGVASNTFSNTNGNITASISTFVTGTVTITYTYYLVPEPGTWAFMITGLGTGAFALKRRRRRFVTE